MEVTWAGTVADLEVMTEATARAAAAEAGAGTSPGGSGALSRAQGDLAATTGASPSTGARAGATATPGPPGAAPAEGPASAWAPDPGLATAAPSAGGTVGLAETTVAALAVSPLLYNLINFIIHQQTIFSQQVGAAMLATDPVGEATGAMAEVDTRTEGIRMMISGEADDENMLCGVLQVYLQTI